MSTKPQLFGTDGIRGVAGQFPLDTPTVRKIGVALGAVLKDQANPPRVLIGMDTRESSGWITSTLTAGLVSAGVEVVAAGVMTTPGIAFLARHHKFSAGIVISASHNPYEDNGIKVLSSSGTKLPEETELQIENALARALPDNGGRSEPSLPIASHLLDDYLEFLSNLVSPHLSLSTYRLVVDCANGAASHVVPPLLRRMGIQARILNAEPNGQNINLDCGSLHPRTMAEATWASGADLGVAFDGDADRAIFATPSARLADGDHVLYGIAPFFQRRGTLEGNAVVGTLMTNLALELTLADLGISLKRTAVGDKYVLEEMLRSGISLGGEPSGHIIFANLSLAGDGIITLLEVLSLLAEAQESFDDLVRGFRPFPQIIRNVPVSEKPTLDSIPEVRHAIEECGRELHKRGRVVVRYSGTESLARVMVEAEDLETVGKCTARIAGAIESAIGVR